MAHLHARRHHHPGWTFPDEEDRKSVHDLQVAGVKGVAYSFLAVLAVLALIVVAAYFAIEDAHLSPIDAPTLSPR